MIVADGAREIFLRNMASVLSNWSKWHLLLLLQCLITAEAFDEHFPMMGLSPASVKMLYSFARTPARWFGLRPWYKEYTPERLWARADNICGYKEKSA